MSLWAAIWMGWLALFVLIEGIALKRSAPDDTLSENVRQWFATNKGVKDTPVARVKHVVLISFMVWLTVHFLVPGFV